VLQKLRLKHSHMNGSEQFLFQNVEGLLIHLPVCSQNEVPSGHPAVPPEVVPPFEMPTGPFNTDVTVSAMQSFSPGMHLFCSAHHFSPLGQKGEGSGVGYFTKQGKPFGMHYCCDTHHF
jgi:hypothetical protein